MNIAHQCLWGSGTCTTHISRGVEHDRWPRLRALRTPPTGAVGSGRPRGLAKPFREPHAVRASSCPPFSPSTNAKPPAQLSQPSAPTPSEALGRLIPCWDVSASQLTRTTHGQSLSRNCQSTAGPQSGRPDRLFFKSPLESTCQRAFRSPITTACAHAAPLPGTTFTPQAHQH